MHVCVFVACVCVVYSYFYIDTISGLRAVKLTFLLSCIIAVFFLAFFCFILAFFWSFYVVTTFAYLPKRKIEREQNELRSLVKGFCNGKSLKNIIKNTLLKFNLNGKLFYALIGRLTKLEN